MPDRLILLWSLLLESRHLRRIAGALAVFAVIHLLGTAGYLAIAPAGTSALDALYMTFITVSTIGYAEVIDLAGHPGGRLFTMAVAFTGIGTMTFMFSGVTAFMLESDLNRTYRRRRMQAKIDQISDHYLVCGAGRIGGYVLDELDAAGLRHVVIELDHASVERLLERHPRRLALEGDAADDDVLTRAGVARCRGVFAVTGDDSKNLVVSLSAKQLNPTVRVVARVHDPRNVAKTLRAGADEIVSPDFTGGHRIASLMIRPQMVSLVDELLRSGGPLSVEEVQVPVRAVPMTVGELGRSPEWLLVAVRNGTGWSFNPVEAQTIAAGDVLIVIGSQVGRRQLEERVAS